MVMWSFLNLLMSTLSSISGICFRVRKFCRWVMRIISEFLIFSIYIYIYLNLVSEARRRWSKNSKIRALWMNEKNGGPKSFIRAGRNKVYPSHFRRLRIWGERSGVRIIGERFTFRVRPRMSDVLLLLLRVVWAMGIWVIMVLCVGKIFMLLRRGLVGTLNIGLEVWIGEWSHGYLHLAIQNFFETPGLETEAEAEAGMFHWKILYLCPKKSFFFFFSYSLRELSFLFSSSIIHMTFFSFRERERRMYIIIRLSKFV